MQAPVQATALNLQMVEPIDAAPSIRDSRLVRSDERSVVAEKYRLLSHRIQREREQRPIQTVLVTSSIPAEGKTSVAANLASVLARNGIRVLLIDADLRAPDLPKAFGLPNDLPGLTNVIAGELPLALALRRITPGDIFYLPAGAAHDEPVPLLESPAFKYLIAAARQSFEWIIIDSPPLAPFADSHCLASQADGVLLVVRWGVTPRGELDNSLAALNRTHLLGMVLNSYDEPQHDDYYSYYKRGRSPRLSVFARS